MDQPRFDSVIDKCEAAFREIHRPISASKTAEVARISVVSGSRTHQLGEEFNEQTYEYTKQSNVSDYPDILHGWVSSFNINTFWGRIFISEYQRPVPFYLSERAREQKNVIILTTSLSENAKARWANSGQLKLRAFLVKSRSEQVKRLIVVDLEAVGEEY